MTDAVERALSLWAQPPPAGEAAEDAFRTAYADPVTINGTPMSACELVERARATHAALADIAFELVERIDAGDKCAIAFRQSGTHVGMLPLEGAVAPTGERVSGLGIDVFTLVDDRISEIWVVSEVLGKLVRS